MLNHKGKRILLQRLDCLVKQIKSVGHMLDGFDYVRYKPLFASYNSCEEEFKRLFPNEFGLLKLEPVPLMDEQGNYQYTGKKLSTIFHQAQSMLAFLEGVFPKNPTLTPASLKESLSWYWHNAHWSLIVSAVLVAASLFWFGVFVGHSEWYNKNIDPLVSEYASQKSPHK